MSNKLQILNTAHKSLLPYLWTVGIDIAIICAMNQYKVFNIIIHQAIGLFVCIATWVSIFPLFLKYGIQTQQDQFQSRRHKLMGLAIIIILFFQIFSGVVSAICKVFIKKTHPYVIFFLNVFHKYLGYPFTVFCKVHIYLTVWADSKTLFWILLSLEIILFLLWIAHKLFFPKLTKTIFPQIKAQNLQKIQKVQKLQEVKTESKNLGVFANYVYDITPLQHYHPQGYRIIDSIKNRDFDRYLYGMYATQRAPFIKPHAHSYKTLDMLSQPIAKIQIPKLYQGLNQNHNQFIIQKIIIVSQQTKIYQIILKKITGQINYKGYSHINQIGRYFSFTINDNITRLYTTVGFLQNQNNSSVKINYPSVQLPSPSSNRQITQEQMEGKKHRDYKNCLHLLLKIYPDGKLTPELLKPIKSIRISQERGQGLNLEDVDSGNLIIVAGGTGLFPFSDLIDLLHKSILLKKNDSNSSKILKENPILESKPFQRFTFQLFLAVQTTKDIHPLTAYQLAYLSQLPQLFQLTIKSRSLQKDSVLNKKQIKMTQKRFDELVSIEIDNNNYKKIFICGPPMMQEAMMNMFDQKQIDRSKYLFV